MQAVKRIRRSRPEWQSIIEAWQASQLSSRQFCSENNLPYASFCNWRRKLSQGSEVDSESESFFKLFPVNESPGSGWHITLKLGGDVELVLSR